MSIANRTRVPGLDDPTRRETGVLLTRGNEAGNADLLDMQPVAAEEQPQLRFRVAGGRCSATGAAPAGRFRHNSDVGLVTGRPVSIVRPQPSARCAARTAGGPLGPAAR